MCLLRQHFDSVCCSFLPRIFANLTGTLPPSLPGVRPPAWPGPKPRFSSCFWGVFILPGLLQYIYIQLYTYIMCIYIYIHNMYISPKAQSLALALLSAQATEVSRRPAASPPRQSSACRRNVFRMSTDVGCGMWDVGCIGI